MKVFISWSGGISQKLGSSLKEWIPDVLQAVHTYFTPEDIQKGERWSSEIAKELEESMFGIFCVTPENLNSGWMHFEAGAISKNKTDSQVCPILFGLRPTDLTGPLQQFQATIFSREEIYKLIKNINEKLCEQKLPENRLNKQFQRSWTDLESEVKFILNQYEDQHNSPQRSERELLEEILTIVREYQKNEHIFKLHNNSENISKSFHELTIQYIKTVKSIEEKYLDSQTIMSHLEKMRSLFKNIIPFLQISRQHKVEMSEALTQLSFKSELPF